MRFLLLILLIAIAPNTAVSKGRDSKAVVRVTVTEQINDRPRELIRYLLIKKAQLSGFVDLPHIVSGGESLQDNQYSSNIEVVSIGAVRVDVITESWQKEKNLVTLTADVFIDKNLTSKLTSQFVQNKLVEVKLTQIYAGIDQLLQASSTSETSMLKLYSEIIQFSSSHLIRNSIKQSSAASVAFEDSLRDLLIIKYLLPYLASIRITLINVDEDKIRFQVALPKRWLDAIEEAKQDFESNFLISSFWQKVTSSFFPCMRVNHYGSNGELIDVTIRKLDDILKYSGWIKHNDVAKNLADFERNISLTTCYSN